MRTLGITGLLCLMLAAGCGRDTDTLTGEWDGSSSEWGKVNFKGGLQGTYTDTYGPPPGTLTMERTSPRTYRGTWKENEKHGGTLSFTLSEDGQSATGIYKVWDTSPRRPGHEGKVVWKRP